MTDKQIVKELHKISDKLDSVYTELYGQNKQATLPSRLKIQSIDALVLSLAGQIIADSNEVI